MKRKGRLGSVGEWQWWTLANEGRSEKDTRVKPDVSENADKRTEVGDRPVESDPGRASARAEALKWDGPNSPETAGLVGTAAHAVLCLCFQPSCEPAVLAALFSQSSKATHIAGEEVEPGFRRVLHRFASEFQKPQLQSVVATGVTPGTAVLA